MDKKKGKGLRSARAQRGVDAGGVDYSHAGVVPHDDVDFNDAAREGAAFESLK